MNIHGIGYLNRHELGISADVDTEALKPGTRHYQCVWKYSYSGQGYCSQHNDFWKMYVTQQKVEEKNKTIHSISLFDKCKIWNPLIKLTGSFCAVYLTENITQNKKEITAHMWNMP